MLAVKQKISPVLHKHLSAIGAKGGEAKSPKKTAACRVNAKLPRVKRNKAKARAAK